jgi:competence protein ComEC
LLLAPKAVPARYLGLLFILPIWLWRPLPPAINTAQVTVLDVGQGLAVVIRSHQHVVVYDTGPSYPEGFDSGLRVLWPYLRSLGINHIDRLIISHSDNDHAGGAQSLLNNMPALAIDSSDSHLFAEAKPCNAYQSWQWDGVQFNYLNVGGYKTHNANSCVLRIVVGEQQLLLPGDIGKTTEKQLLNHNSNALPASILIAPHHGSLSSSSMAFIEAVHPQYVVFATGKDNRFHFPKPQIVARYQQIGAKLYDTAKQGAIIFELSGKGEVAAPKTMLP